MVTNFVENNEREQSSLNTAVAVIPCGLPLRHVRIQRHCLNTAVAVIPCGLKNKKNMFWNFLSQYRRSSNTLWSVHRMRAGAPDKSQYRRSSNTLWSTKTYLQTYLDLSQYRRSSNTLWSFLCKCFHVSRKVSIPP